MDKKTADKRKAEGWRYIGIWITPEDVRHLEDLMKRLGYVESAPFFRRLLAEKWEAEKK